MSARPWTEAHRREALRRFRERSALCEGWIDKLAQLDEEARVGGEVGLRRALRELGLPGTTIAHDVARVRGLAEGRLVRSEERVVTWPDGINRPLFADTAVPKGWPILRVTRIRRAS